MQRIESLNALLKEAVLSGDLDHARLYVAKGADVHMRVAGTGELMRYPVFKNSSGTAPLYHYMLSASFSEAMSDFLLSQGVDVDVENDNGNTPLMLAVRNGLYDRVKYFLGKGADPLHVNKDGEMVLEMARRISASDVGARQKIIDALLSPLPDVKADMNKAAAPSGEKQVATTQGVTVTKPLQVNARKAPPSSGGGFKL
jgi:hypothetical protein